MIWKVIGQSVIGTSHISSGKGCEDAVLFKIIKQASGDEVLVGFVSDGAGSAAYAAEASAAAVNLAVSLIENWINDNIEFDESDLLQLAESIYDELETLASKQEVSLHEFSCTFLGIIIFQERACFIQIGDGAIVRNDDSGFFTHVWWPHNDEYQNTTTFLIDDPDFRSLNIKIIHEEITEVAVFTDGLQMLALNNEFETVHQPFFTSMFNSLRLANNENHIEILNRKLIEYLSGTAINNRTDDDKTLLLASKINHDSKGF